MMNLFLLWIACVLTMPATAETDDSSAVILDVSHNSNPGTQSGFLAISCSLDLNRTKLETVASLAVFGSKSYGEEGELDQLASVDMWSNNPKVASELEKSQVTVSGETGPGRSSSLTLSWNSPTKMHCHSYTCRANGIDKEGQAVSVSTTVKLEGVSSGCCQNIDHISAEVQTLTATIEASTNSSSGISQQMNLLNNRLGVLEEKLDSNTLSTRIHSTLLTIDHTKFDVSDVYKGHLYLASRQQAKFDLQKAQAACLTADGYLCEIDDIEETQFTLAFAKRIGGSDHFFTGGNDVKQEGKFIYINSKKPVPEDIWKSGEPNNRDGKEDCMEIFRHSKEGLFDKSCETEAKFICEVPLRFK